MLGRLGSIDITSRFLPLKKPRQVFLPPGYGFAIWFKSGELTWQTMFTC